MRVVAIALIALLAINTNAITVRNKVQVTKAKIDELKKSGTWGAIFMTMMELRARDGDPVQDLIDAIVKLISDLNAAKDKAVEDLNERTSEHESEVVRLEDLIADAQSDIAHAEQFLEATLYPAREQLQADLDRFHAEIDENNQIMEELTNVRNDEHQEYENAVLALQDGIDGVDEAIELLNSLNGATLSLAQIKNTKQSLAQVSKKLGKTARMTDTHLIKALISVASGEFSDSGTVGKIAGMLEDIRQQLVDALSDAHAKEEEAQAEYERQIDEYNEANQQIEGEIVRYSGELEATIRNIEDKEQFAAGRKADLAGFEHNLEDENTNFDNYVELHNDLMAELARELDGSNEALNVVQNADFGSINTQ